VKIHSSTVVVPLAIVLLVVGAGAVLATTGGPLATHGGGAQAEATATPGATSAPAPTATPGTTVPGNGPSTGPAAGPFKGLFNGLVADADTALKTALDKLVANGTITANQETAILDAVKAERQARVADLQAQRKALQAQRDLIRGFLSDGQITQDELNQLPADSPLRQLTSLMADGKITVDELRQLGRGLFLPGVLGRGHGFFGKGPGPHTGAPDATASPAPTTGG
jgi:polyhydroxyalkanoate synthesis regulator phasin